MNDAMPHWLKNTLLLGLALSSALMFFGVFSLYRLNKNSIETAQASAKKRVQQTAQLVDHFIQILKSETEKISENLASTSIEKNSLEKLLCQKPIEISGLGVITNADSAPSGYYCVEKDDRQQFIQLTPNDINNFAFTNHTEFYGPIIDPITLQQTVVYAKKLAPNNTMGFATQTFAHIDHILSTLYIGKSGYLAITDQDGTILFHPQATLRGTKASLVQPHTWQFTELLPTIGWQLHGIFMIKETSYDKQAYRHTWFLILITLLLSLILACILLISHEWFIVISVSLALATTITGFWLVTQRYPKHKKDTFIPIKNKISLYQFLDSQKKPEKKQSKDLTLETLQYYLGYRYKESSVVPTGIYIQDLAALNPETIDFDGFIWQRYFDGIHDRLSRGFIFPQAAKKATVTEIFRNKKDKTETIIWQVNAQLNQELRYTLYPFDGKKISIEIAHKDFNKNILLVPDLDAYPLINPSMLPGINPNLYIADWQVNRTGFEYHIEQFQTNFGLYAYGPFGTYKTEEQTESPLMTFSIRLERNLLQALITDLLPLIIIALLLFICFISDIQQGFSGFVPSLAGIFFATIVSHLSFRGKIPPHEFVYLETFYLIMYIMLTYVTIFSMLSMFELPIAWIQKNNNRNAKSLYWPVLLSLVLVVTVWYLY